MGRSLIAIIVGALVAVGLAWAGDHLIVDVLAPSPGAAVIANNLYVAYEVGIGLFAGIVAGFVAATAAGRMPFGHGIALGVILLLVSVFQMASNSSGQPEWYLAMLGMVALVSTSLGGWLCALLVKRMAAAKEAARMPKARA